MKKTLLILSITAFSVVGLVAQDSTSVKAKAKKMALAKRPMTAKDSAMMKKASMMKKPSKDSALNKLPKLK